MGRMAGWCLLTTTNALSEALLEFIKDPNRGKELVRNGKETVKEYSIGQIAKQYETLYEEIRK